jgi:hypothetical protein
MCRREVLRKVRNRIDRQRTSKAIVKPAATRCESNTWWLEVGMDVLRKGESRCVAAYEVKATPQLRFPALFALTTKTVRSRLPPRI